MDEYSVIVYEQINHISPDINPLYHAIIPLCSLCVLPIFHNYTYFNPFRKFLKI